MLFKRIQKEFIKTDTIDKKKDKIKEKNNDKKIDKINDKKIDKINNKKIDKINDKKIDKINDKKIENKKEKKIIQKELSPKKILTTNNSQKEIEKIEKIKKQDTVIELKIKEQEKTIEKQKETISKLMEELKIYKDNDTRNGIFVIKQNKTLNISENYITINDEIVILVKGSPLEYIDTYSYTMEIEVDKLKSKEIYIDNKKINDNEYEIIDNRYIKLHFEKTFNNEKRKIKVIQVIPHEFQFYSYYDLNLNHNNVLTKYIISHDDNIKIDDITNEYFKRNKSLNLIYFEGKTTNEMIVKPGSVFFSKKILYSIYDYIPEFKSKEDNIIKMKESNNKIAVNILARYKKVIITNYGQEVEDIYKIKISNYETKVYCVNLNYPLIVNQRYEVNLVELNGQKVEYSAEDSSITILNFGAFNNQFAEVHFKYKYFNDDKDIFRQETIITSNVKNSYCKLIIEIPEENVVISTNDIYSKNENKNNEYIFDGISKEDELTEIIHFSNKKAEWDIQKEITLQSKENIENCTFKVNRMFKGGNLKVESYEISKDNSEFIDDEEKDKFIFKYNKLNVNKVSIGLKLKVKNSTADYNFDGNEELLIKIPEEDKQFFKDLSDKILNEDKSNFPIYKKLGKWVYNYMTYNLLLTGRNMTAREIYNKKIGVCEHFTLLYNTLLVSQGIKAIKVSGFALNRNKNQQNKEQNTLKDNRHCWTLALIDGVWVPLDATWNLFEKKLPLSHIFQNYGNCNFLTTSDIKNNVTNEVTKEIIKQTEN